MGGGESKLKESVIKKDATSNQEAESRGVTMQLEQVKTKLLVVDPNLKTTPNKLKEEAKCLSDADEFVLAYCGHLLEIGNYAVQAIEREQKYFPDGYCNEATRIYSTDRMHAEVQELDNLEVKLLLYEINDQSHIQKMASIIHGHFHDFEFGPFHAAILIGDVLLDWGPTELVRPKRLAGSLHKAVSGQRSPIFMGNVHTPPSGDESNALFEHLPVRGGAKQTQEGFKETIAKLNVKRMEKEQLLRELAEVAVSYNIKHRYGLLTDNCHHFVLAILNALCITDYKEMFEGRLKAHAAILTQRDQQKKKIVEYNSHQELDTHVRNHIDEMPREEMEFAYCHYLLFHAWAKKFPNERAWVCNEDTCRCDELYEKLEGRSS